MNVRKPGGFTLIELLVVIAIISLLVSILLPSLSRAKLLAQSVVCLNNLRTYGMANQQYAAECQGVYTPMWWEPDTYQESAEDNRWPWYGYPLFRIGLGLPTGDEDYTDWETLGVSQGLTCPQASWILDRPNSNGTYDLRGCYAMNFECSEHVREQTWEKEWAYWKASEVKNPAGTICYADSLDFLTQAFWGSSDRRDLYHGVIEVKGGEYVGAADYDVSCHQIAYRHSDLNIANASMFDGHAENLTFDRVMNDLSLYDVLGLGEAAMKNR